MIPFEKILPQILFVICSVVALLILFVEIGLSNLTVLQWVAVGLAGFGLIGNILIIIGKSLTRASWSEK